MTIPLTARLEELIRTLYPEPCECENGSGLVCGGCLGREELRMLVSGVLEVGGEGMSDAKELDRLRSLLRSDKKYEELAIENKLYKLLAWELAAELRRWFECRPIAWRFDPAAWVGPSAIEREGFLALRGSAAELLSRPEVRALIEEEK